MIMNFSIGFLLLCLSFFQLIVLSFGNSNSNTNSDPNSRTVWVWNKNLINTGNGNGIRNDRFLSESDRQRQHGAGVSVINIPSPHPHSRPSSSSVIRNPEVGEAVVGLLPVVANGVASILQNVGTASAGGGGSNFNDGPAASGTIGTRGLCRLGKERSFNVLGTIWFRKADLNCFFD